VLSIGDSDVVWVSVLYCYMMGLRGLMLETHKAFHLICSFGTLISTVSTKNHRRLGGTNPNNTTYRDGANLSLGP
jgi:hypothetical protein